MSERRQRQRTKNRTVAYVAAGLVHAIIIGALFVNFSSKPKPEDAAYAKKVDVVKADIVTEDDIKKQQDTLKKLERDKQRKKDKEQRDLEKLKKDSAKEKQRIKDLQAQQQQEKKKAAELEKERKVIALKRKKEKDQRDKELREQKRRDDLAANKKREQQELDRIRREEQELAAHRQLNESLAAEERFLADQKAKERTTTLRSKYVALIKLKVDGERIVAPDTERWRKATINVKLSSSGDVLSVRTVKSSGSVRYDRDVETAIYQASPLPIPTIVEDLALNREFQNLNLAFDMNGI